LSIQLFFQKYETHSIYSIFTQYMDFQHSFGLFVRSDSFEKVRNTLFDIGIELVNNRHDICDHFKSGL
jgi:hypothetical protein